MPSLRSMTAFGRGSKGSFIVEIQSVNRRFLEINFLLPKHFALFETMLRKHLQKRVGRGMISLFVKYSPSESEQVAIVPNIALAKGLLNGWQKVASTLQLEEKISLSLLAREKELFTFSQEKTIGKEHEEALREAVDSALDQLIAMKEAEGSALQKDLLERLETLRKNCEWISGNSKNATENYRLKLQERLKQLIDTSLENDERFLKEVALFAERVDITEEIIRLSSHIERASELLESELTDESETKGRNLDFLVQEMLREVNTIGSKASDKQIIHLVIESKAELEKIKEQAQNIE